MESIISLLEATHSASKFLRRISQSKKAKILNDLAWALEQNADRIIEKNQIDLSKMDPKDPKFDRLLLNPLRINSLVESLMAIAKLDDPTGKILNDKTLTSGIKMQKVSVPMGVIGAIFESRPNVTIDVAALCIMSGNASVLKGGKEAGNSNRILVEIIQDVLKINDLPAECVLLLPTDRKFLIELLEATRHVDLIIPRGSQGLIDYVRANSKIPTIETGAGVVHTYIEKTANINMAAQIIVNARASRPSVCNSLDCAIIDKEIIDDLAEALKDGLIKYNVEVYADDEAYEAFQKINYPFLKHALDEDFGKEWLDYKISIKTVSQPEQALNHIEKYSSRHSEAIVTEDLELAERFLHEVDAAAVYHNASTRYTDGGEYGLGAEIGISTQKLHARGPFALEKLVTEKWICRGTGQVRW